MTLETALKYLKRHAATLNYSGVAEQLGMDASNFHKVIAGNLKLSPERLEKLGQIIKGLKK